MHQFSPVCDNIVPYCLCVQQWMQGPGLPPFNQWISRCDRCKITWNVQATCYQNLFHQMNISIFFLIYIHVHVFKMITINFFEFGLFSNWKAFKRKKNCKMMSKSIKMKENKVVIGLLIHCLSDSPSEAMKLRNSWSSTRGWSLWSWLFLLTDIRLSVLLQS